jgi:serine/threonine protein kinase
LRRRRTVSALNHPNILTIHELGRDASLHYIVTEYIEGRTLRERMSTAIPLAEALDIASHIATGLAAAHRAGIIHRDLKPENVMIRTDGLVKLLDFGVASLIEHVASVSEIRLTSEYEIIGTLPYMSPEQLRAERVDARTDVYSLALVLFEMLAGRRPFDAPKQVDLIAAIVGQEAPPNSSSGWCVTPGSAW